MVYEIYVKLYQDSQKLDLKESIFLFSFFTIVL